jgi:chaperonin GroES
MSLKVLDSKIAICPIEAAEQTSGGIIIPEGFNSTICYGKIIAMGDWADRELRTGHIIIYKPDSGTSFKHEGKDVVVLNESDILAVVED